MSWHFYPFCYNHTIAIFLIDYMKQTLSTAASADSVHTIRIVGFVWLLFSHTRLLCSCSVQRNYWIHDQQQRVVDTFTIATLLTSKTQRLHFVIYNKATASKKIPHLIDRRKANRIRYSWRLKVYWPISTCHYRCCTVTVTKSGTLVCFHHW